MLVREYLKRAINNGTDAEARDGMALADTLIGFSISISLITMCHAIAHAVAGVCDSVHGITLAALTPCTMRHSMHGNPQKFKKIGTLLAGYEAQPEGWTCEDSVRVVEDFIKDIGLAIPLSKQGVSKNDFDEIIAGTMGYMSPAVEADLVEVNAEEVRVCLEKSF